MKYQLDDKTKEIFSKYITTKDKEVFLRESRFEDFIKNLREEFRMIPTEQILLETIKATKKIIGVIVYSPTEEVWWK